MWWWRLGSGFVKTCKGLLVFDVVDSTLDMGSCVMLIGNRLRIALLIDDSLMLQICWDLQVQRFRSASTLVPVWGTEMVVNLMLFFAVNNWGYLLVTVLAVGSTSRFKELLDFRLSYVMLSWLCILVIMLIVMGLYGLERVVNGSCRCCRELMVRESTSCWWKKSWRKKIPYLN